ncbi:MAG: hypothetical protein ACPGU5_01685 [Lishizhenia sp.]
MNRALQNGIALIVGLIIGSAVNMLIIHFGPSIIAPPEGVDPNDVETIKANIHLYSPAQFMIPFLAHALGTLIGAFVAAKIAKSYKLTFALIIAALFLVGGSMMVVLLPKTPIWFILLDLVVAYIPMGYLGYWLNTKN